MAGITNTAIYDILTKDVMPALVDIEVHLARLNGSVDHLKERADSHTRRMGKIEDDSGDLSTRVGRMEGAMGAQVEQIRDVKTRHAVLDNRVVQTMVEVAKWGVMALGLAKGLEELASALQ